MLDRNAEKVTGFLPIMVDCRGLELLKISIWLPMIKINLEDIW